MVPFVGVRLRMPAVLEGKGRSRNRRDFLATIDVKEVKSKMPTASLAQDNLQTSGKQAELFQRLLLLIQIQKMDLNAFPG